MAFVIDANAQNWNIVNSRSIEDTGRKSITPNDFLTAYVDDSLLKNMLWEAPDISNPNNKNNYLNVMLPNRRADRFAIFEYSMMEDELAIKFPNFKTFIGYSETDPSRSIRIDYTALGFRAVISDSSGKTYIDNFQSDDNNHKIIYHKKDLNPKGQWLCEIDDTSDQLRENGISRLAGDCQLREYRLAVATTGEYTAYHGGTVDLGMSAIVTAINRVNEIYENDLSIRLVLIGNNDLLIYTNSNSDPYTNNSGMTMLSQNQSNIDAVIGNNNYDVGHVFSTAGGGVASLGSACVNSIKARGVTGLPDPIGDPFYVDYVSHELGHQFGANHTFNSDEGGCSGNRNEATAFEPGSGSTIMGYAGICGTTQNVQNFSDAYFHAISIQEISTHISQPSDCSSTSNNNNAPLASSISNYNVPISTPLVLEANANDSDGDMLTFCWEQMDNETGYTTPPASTNIGGPMFRSLSPTTDSKRYLPSIDNIVNGTADTWEVLPSVTRNLNFRMTVRDNASTYGCTDEKDMIINVSETAGPFVVTSFNTPDTFLEGESITVTWDVANTDVAPINSTLVDILLSYDGGYTYPETLATAVANDGSQVVTIPVGITTMGRMMVRGNGNIFFDINDSDFEIKSGGPTYTLSTNPPTGEICNSSSLQFDLLTSSIGGFDTPIDINVSGLPLGATAIISSNPVTPGNSTSITLENFGSNSGIFNITINGNATGDLKEANYTLDLKGSLSPPTLSSPSNLADGISTMPILEWNVSSGADTYDYQLSTLPGGVGLIESGNTADTSAQITTNLSTSTSYYWRVRSTNTCGASSWSADSSFTTSTCTIINYNESPIQISSIGTPTINSVITFPSSGVITDINVINLKGNHTWGGDLRFRITSPENTSINLLDRECGSLDDFDLNFDDGASNISCPLSEGITFNPEIPLSAFNGENPAGQWTLTVDDFFDQDGGWLNSWGIEVCFDLGCELVVTNTDTSGVGSLRDVIDCAQPGDIITLSPSIAGMTIDLTGSELEINKELTIEAAPADNITITSSGSYPTLTLGSGETLTLKGFTIQSTSEQRETIFNRGTIKLDNMVIRHLVNKEQIVNDALSQLIVMGTSSLKR